MSAKGNDAIDAVNGNYGYRTDSVQYGQIDYFKKNEENNKRALATTSIFNVAAYKS